MKPQKHIETGRIVRTDRSCKIGHTEYPGIPTLIWSNGIDELVSDHLRHLIVFHGLAPSTVYEYAKLLRIFKRFCLCQKRSWDSVDDQFLIIWRENMRRSGHADAHRINKSLLAIFGFYRWAEENGHLRHHVGIYEADETTEISERGPFPISTVKKFSKGRHGRVYGRYTTPLTVRASRSTQGRRHTPTEDESRRIHEVAAVRQFGERNTLIYSWAEETGLRRAELLRVCVSALPTLDQLDEIIEHDDQWHVNIVRKRGATWSVAVPLDLILRTLDWVKFGRYEIVARCHKTTVGYVEPDVLFISGRTGLALHPDSVTTLSRRDFADAGVKKASLHRFRAKHCIEVIEALVDSIFGKNLPDVAQSGWIETILTKASEMMGHISPASLGPYLNYVFDRKLRTEDAMTRLSLQVSVRQLEQKRDTLLREIDKLSSRLRST